MREKKFKNFIFDLFFPKFCLGCQKEGNYLCPDCQAVLEISKTHRKHQTKQLSDLYFAIGYQQLLIKNLIQKFKYPPFVKELSENLVSLILEHFQLINNSPLPFFGKRVLIPVPLEKGKLKWRGFNQAEEIAKKLSKFLNIQVLNKVLIKIKNTPPQVELSGKERKKNLKEVFICQNKNLIKGKKILLVDDVYTTGTTMEECARVLKKAEAKEIIGIVVAKAKPGQDYLQRI